MQDCALQESGMLASTRDFLERYHILVENIDSRCRAAGFFWLCVETVHSCLLCILAIFSACPFFQLCLLRFLG